MEGPLKKLEVNCYWASEKWMKIKNLGTIFAGNSQSFAKSECVDAIYAGITIALAMDQDVIAIDRI